MVLRHQNFTEKYMGRAVPSRLLCYHYFEEQKAVMGITDPEPIVHALISC